MCNIFKVQQGQKAHVINLYMWCAMENARTFFIEDFCAYVFEERIRLSCLGDSGIDLFHVAFLFAFLGIDLFDVAFFLVSLGACTRKVVLVDESILHVLDSCLQLLDRLWLEILNCLPHYGYRLCLAHSSFWKILRERCKLLDKFDDQVEITQ